MNEALSRYARQVLFPSVDEAGQHALLAARVTFVGVGATGSVLATYRAGVAHLRLIDGDFIERNKLRLQLLYDEEDLTALVPRATAAGRKLRRLNSTIEIEDRVRYVGM